MKETHLTINGVNVIIRDPCVTEEQKQERKKRIEQALIRFFTQVEKEKRRWKSTKLDHIQ